MIFFQSGQTWLTCSIWHQASILTFPIWRVCLLMHHALILTYPSGMSALSQTCGSYSKEHQDSNKISAQGGPNWDFHYSSSAEDMFVSSSCPSTQQGQPCRKYRTRVCWHVSLVLSHYLTATAFCSPGDDWFYKKRMMFYDRYRLS